MPKPGLGWEHQKQRAYLLAKHVDGSQCEWCSRPMFRAASRNFDGRALQADHRVPRSLGGRKADRLLHATCNRERSNHDDDIKPDAPRPRTSRQW